MTTIHDSVFEGIHRICHALGRADVLKISNILHRIISYKIFPQEFIEFPIDGEMRTPDYAFNVDGTTVAVTVLECGEKCIIWCCVEDVIRPISYEKRIYVRK